MIDLVGKYQASVFGDFTSIEATPEVISKLLDMFQDKKLLPGIMQEIGPTSPSPIPRVQFSSPKSELTITFGTGRIDIAKNPTDTKGSNLGSVEDFTNEAHDILTRILVDFKKKGNRLALITSALLVEMSKDKFDEIYKKTFNSITFYQDNLPFEWNSRSASRITVDINGSSEEFNIITKLNRVHGQHILSGSVLKFDRIEIGFDINTTAENKDFRFDSGSITSFFEETIKIRDSILSQLEDFLNA